MATVEDVRAYWDRRPCNIRHSMAPLGTRDYFDEVAERKYKVEPHIPGFAEFDRWRGKRVLEIGCGLGTDAINFARAGADYTGIDLSQAALDLARRRFEVYGLEGCLIHANGEELGRHFPGERFDLVYSFGVIHHTPNPRRIIQSARRLIAPDGDLRIMLYARNSWKAALIDADLDQPEAQSGCPIADTYTLDRVEALLSGLFEITSLTQDHIFPFVIEKYIRYEYKKQPWFKAMPAEMFRALEQQFGWHMLIKARPIRAS